MLKLPPGQFIFKLGGPGLAYVNYNIRLQKKEDGLGFRAGVGGFKVDVTGALFVPLGLTYLPGKDQKNYFEFGWELRLFQ